MTREQELMNLLIKECRCQAELMYDLDGAVRESEREFLRCKSLRDAVKRAIDEE